MRWIVRLTSLFFQKEMRVSPSVLSPLRIDSFFNRFLRQPNLYQDLNELWLIAGWALAFFLDPNHRDEVIGVVVVFTYHALTRLRVVDYWTNGRRLCI